MATGLISTSSITDATPAGFVTHRTDRLQQNAIAADIANKDVDVLIGGGLSYFLPAASAGSYRKDDIDPIAILSKDHTVVTTPQDFKRLGQPQKLAAFLANEDLPNADLRQVSLSDMVAKALDVLSTKKEGFFLMAEGSQIDWAGHHGFGEYLIRETVDLDRAVGVGLEFAKKHGDTLVIVCADHETGGYALLGGSKKDQKITQAVFLVDSHTGSMVPIFAYGPGGEAFGGIHSVAFVGQKLIEYVQQRGAAK
jgi:alkaline phosphatase